MSPLGGGSLGSTPLGGGGSGPATSVIVVPPPAPGASFQILIETGGYGSGITTNITADVTKQTRTVRRGYMTTDPDDVLAAPATFSFGLDNSSQNSTSTQGRYSLDTASKLPGWGTGIRVLYLVMVNGMTRTRFVGWIKRVEVQPGLFEDQTVKVMAVSWLGLASKARATGIAAQANQHGHQLVATAINLAQFPPPAVVLNPTVDVYPYAFWDLDPKTAKIADAIDAAVGSGLDRFHELADGTVVIESRQFRELGASANVLTLSDIAPSGHPFLAITGMNPYQDLDRVWSDFGVTVHPGRVDPAPVVLYAYQTTGSTTTVGPLQSMVLSGPYVDPSQQAQYVGGFEMVDDTANGRPGFLPASDYQFFDGPNGTGNNVSAYVTVAVAFEGNQATFTITNTLTLTVYLAKLQCRGRGIYNYQDAIGRASVEGVIASAFGESASVDCKYQTDPVFARNAAKYLVARHSPKQTQIDQGVRIMVSAGAQADMDAVLAVDISSPIGASETVSGLIGGDYWVNAVQEEYDERTNLTWTGFLEPRDPNKYWRLGVAGFGELDQTAAVAYL